MAGIWIFAETYDQTLELINAGYKLAAHMQTELTVLTRDKEEVAAEYIACGADQVLLLAPLQKDQSLEEYVPVITDEARRENPDMFLVAGTQRGKEIAARIAALLKTGLCSECTSFRIDEETKNIFMERLVFGGAAVQTVICTTRPQMATIPPGTFEPALKQEGRTGEIKQFPSYPPFDRVKVLNRKPKEHHPGDISNARVVVCAGRGIEKEEDLGMVRDLAEVVGGEIGCTRPLCEEFKWLSEEVCIGLSGKQVKPDFYLGLGISGQVQHVTGIKDARIICVINNDENAPIFEVADYGVVGDIVEVVPRLIRELKRKSKK